MADLYGMTGKIARVDLTSGNVTVIEPGEEVYRKYLGGSALGAYFLMSKKGLPIRASIRWARIICCNS